MVATATYPDAFGHEGRNNSSYYPSDVTATQPISMSAPKWQRFRRYSGVGFLISVGYMDPGNWATDIAAGSHFGYGLLCVILLSSLIAMVLQTLCVRLGVATGQNLAQLCRAQFSPRVNLMLWAFAQIAIIACDFAEVLGCALALKLLTGLPLSYGILLTAFDTIIILMLQNRGMLRIETIVIALVTVITAAFCIEIIMAAPDWAQVANGFVPSPTLFKNPQVWLVAIGILGATVMPHNLYLHSSVVSSRRLVAGNAAKDDAIRLLTADTLITLSLAFFVNAAILIVAASTFHFSGYENVTSIDDAHRLLSPLLGATAASVIFALALLAAGQSSTLTGTMAGQIVLQGFLNLKIPRWQQRFMTRLSAVIPAWIGIMLLGDDSLETLLILSQVVLSMQLPFAVIPLLLFNDNPELMGSWRISKPLRSLCWLICAGIIAANMFLIAHMIP